jgi:Iron-containing redox enzyme
MEAAGLDPTYLAYLDDVPADALAGVNLMSLFGLHRELRGAAIGHFASTEITSSPGSRRLVEALERMGAPEPCVGSTVNTSRPTPSTNKWCAPMSSGISLRANRIWTVAWCSGSRRATSSRTGLPRM